jgi:hypothetical protein
VAPHNRGKFGYAKFGYELTTVHANAFGFASELFDMEGSGASVSLQWVLGASTSAGVKSIDDDTLLYLSGNVGVIYGISRKEQKLLRGHVSCSFSRLRIPDFVPPLTPSLVYTAQSCSRLRHVSRSLPVGNCMRWP